MIVELTMNGYQIYISNPAQSLSSQILAAREANVSLPQPVTSLEHYLPSYQLQRQSSYALFAL